MPEDSHRGRAPALLAVAHGTRDPAGPVAVRSLLDRVRALRPGLRVAEAYGELSEPSLEDAAAALRDDGPVVVVPLLLARGYHALIDIPDRASRLLTAAVTTPPLGPDALLTTALAARLAESLGGCVPAPGGGGRVRSCACGGVRAGSVAGGGSGGRGAPCTPPRRVDGVVLGAAGSADPAGREDVAAAARLLERRLGRPVPYGFVAADGPPLEQAVAQARRDGARHVAVASYLLAPGRFHGRMADCGADAVTAPLAAHDAVARLVLHRYDRTRPRVEAGLRVG